MAIPDFVVQLRRHVGTAPLWLPAVTAIVVRESSGVREVLLVQRSDNRRWTPVTGIVDPGEQPAVAVRREVLEETGVRVRVDRLASVLALPPTTHANGDQATYLDLTFACSYLGGEAHVADDESLAVRWCPVDDLSEMGTAFRDRVDLVLRGDPATTFVP